MIGDYLIPTGPNYGPFKNGGPYGAIIHDLEAPRTLNVRSFTGPGSYPANAGVSPHIIAGVKEAAQILTERNAGAHVGSRGNMLFVGFEVVGYAKWTKAQWMDDIRPLLNQARAVANLWKVMGWKASDLKWGSLAELKEAKARYDSGRGPAAPRLWTHNDVSEALGGTNHWDPGLGFPFAEFTRWCLEYLVGKGVSSPGGTPNVPDNPTQGGAETKTQKEEEEMTERLVRFPDGRIFCVDYAAHSLWHVPNMDVLNHLKNIGIKSLDGDQPIEYYAGYTDTTYPLEDKVRRWVAEEVAKVSVTQGFAGSADKGALAREIVETTVWPRNADGGAVNVKGALNAILDAVQAPKA